MLIAVEIYLLVVVLMSLFSIILYAFDKRRATMGGRRVPEKTLHLVAFAGGWPGALYAQQRFRHKTQKVSFRVVFFLVVAVHLLIVGAGTYAWVTSVAPTNAAMKHLR